MGDTEKIVMPLILLLLLLLMGMAIYLFIKQYVADRVKKSSKVINELEHINRKIKYKAIEQNYAYSYICLSRAEFNRFNLENYFIEIINDNEEKFRKIIQSIEHNKKEKRKYSSKLERIDFSQTEGIANSVKIPPAIYGWFEKRYYQKMILPPPVTDISILCRKEYTSPAGRTHTWSDAVYNYKQLIKYYVKAREIKEQREIRSGQIEYERSLMTPSLRYEILKRDNFRCQICGSTAQDGVKLHIDHIVPVSKGGHTVRSNLRVLCDRCNLGKSDKLE